MRPPSASLLRLFSPARSASLMPWTSRGCLLHASRSQNLFPPSPHGAAAFSLSSALFARKKGKGAGTNKAKSKTTLIRYYLAHPRLPRPLRFSRNRSLRHWTIHRAWLLYQTKLRNQRELTLEKQYNSMSAACEALRLMDNTGLTAEEREKIGARDVEPKEVGRLYRIAMLKNGSWDGAPIEYARIQTDSPSKDGWNHAWTR